MGIFILVYLQCYHIWCPNTLEGNSDLQSGSGYDIWVALDKALIFLCLGVPSVPERYQGCQECLEQCGWHSVVSWGRY